MKLRELFDPARCRIIGDPDTQVTGLTYDSRRVSPGDIFFCIRGTQKDGNAYIEAARQAGAAAVMSASAHPDLDMPQVIVENDRLEMARASCAFYGYPAQKMQICAITGTNGKTTTTHMIKHIAEAAGLKVGLIGTICNMIGEETLSAERTTPESPDLQALLSRMAEEECDLVVMEASSHALALDRVGGMQFDVGIFSNLTQDHLDFHGTFENYARAKERLFAASRLSIVNTDDPYGGRMAAAACGDVLTYGMKSGAARAADVQLHADGVRYLLEAPEGPLRIRVGIPGQFSVYNSMAAALAAGGLGIPGKIIARALANMPSVPGRFELLGTGRGGFSLILDYAHTPDSLENVLRTVRQFAQGRITAVFGCGGDRDADKRPKMGAAAARLADRLILTSDNPRREDPYAILAQIEAGLPDGTQYQIIENRREAIRTAMMQAQAGEIILLAGKGHEDYQEINGVKHPFDEKVVVRELVDELGL